MTSVKIFVVSLTHKTNTSHIAVHLFSNRLQKPLTCCKNISGKLGFFCTYHILIASVTYHLRGPAPETIDDFRLKNKIG